VGDSVVNQDDGIGTGAAFLVVDFAFLDFDEMAGSGPSLELSKDVT
jgi:hypothetical protein